MEIQFVLLSLSKVRPIFHSEADFQHALAWELHKLHPSCSIRLEVPERINEKQVHIDIICQVNEIVIGIELKYATSYLEIDAFGEHFHLKNQSADDLTRHGFCRDIERLEQLKQHKRIHKGYSIMLTNNAPLWLPTKTGKPTNFDAFRIHENHELHGPLDWSPNTSLKTVTFVKGGVQISGKYLLHWVDYSQVSSTKNSLFRYLTVTV